MSGRKQRESVAVVSVDRPRQLKSAAPPEERLHRAGRGLSGFVLAVLLAGGIAGLGRASQADTLRLREVTITGASPSVQQAIEDALTPSCDELWPGHVECAPERLGPSLLTLRTADVGRQLKAIPLIKSVRVKAEMPNRLEIAVTERKPEAVWLVGSDTYRVADDGMVIDRGSTDGLKVAIGQVGGDPKKPGDSVDMSIIKGAELLQERLPNELGIPTRRIQYSPDDGLAIIGDQDMIAMFGSPQDLNVKMAELQRIVQMAKDKKATLAFVDLRYKTPYFRIR
jgi:cell division septal protein FtsQ